MASSPSPARSKLRVLTGPSYLEIERRRDNAQQAYRLHQMLQRWHAHWQAKAPHVAHCWVDTTDPYEVPAALPSPTPQQLSRPAGFPEHARRCGLWDWDAALHGRSERRALLELLPRLSAWQRGAWVSVAALGEVARGFAQDPEQFALTPPAWDACREVTAATYAWPSLNWAESKRAKYEQELEDFSVACWLTGIRTAWDACLAPDAQVVLWPLESAPGFPVVQSSALPRQGEAAARFEQGVQDARVRAGANTIAQWRRMGDRLVAWRATAAQLTRPLLDALIAWNHAHPQATLTRDLWLEMRMHHALPAPPAPARPRL